jgi:toxin-antitoxin system PIN domain toxin
MRHLCDANVFIALAVEQHSHHRLAASWFSDLGQEDTAAFCRATQNSFLRLLTRTIAPQYCPLPNRQAWSAYDQLCKDDAISFAEEPAGLETVWRKLSRQTTASPKIWMDTYLAAFAIAGRFRLTTLDRDFKNFEAHGLNLLLLHP